MIDDVGIEWIRWFEDALNKFRMWCKKWYESNVDKKINFSNENGKVTQNDRYLKHVLLTTNKYSNTAKRVCNNHHLDKLNTSIAIYTSDFVLQLF